MIFYNCEAYIAEAIASVRAQTFPDWELVLVDDGSSDGSTAIAAGVAAADPERIRMFQHTDRANHGTGPSRSLGLSQCRGELVAFLDADDVYHPDRLLRHVEIFDRHPDVSLVQGPVQLWRSGSIHPVDVLVDEDEAPLPVPTDQPIDPPQLLLLMIGSKGQTVPAICCQTFRIADVRRLGGFDASFRGAYEDQVLLARLYLNCRTLVVREVLARYRQRSDSNVHVLEKQGNYRPGWPNPAHQAFTQWLQSYVESHPNSSTALSAAIRSELLPYTHPWAWRLWHLPAIALDRVRGPVQRLLPAALVNPVLAWRRRQKEARAARLAAQVARDLWPGQREPDG